MDMPARVPGIGADATMDPLWCVQLVYRLVKKITGAATTLPGTAHLGPGQVCLIFEIELLRNS
jgi:hypothetical protein